MVLEMCIVMQASSASQGNKCPRCRHMNFNATVANGWVEWRVILNDFIEYWV